MNWIVKDEPKQEAPKSFVQVVKEALAETGINPADWTNEELEDWRNISKDWRIVQAARMEYNRRQSHDGSQYKEEIWQR